VCFNSSSTCGVDTTSTQTAYRYKDLCTLHHVESTLGSCYPGTSATSEDSTCMTKMYNSGCAQVSSNYTPWQRELPTFLTYTADPGYGSFAQINHCFDGTWNTYLLGSTCAHSGLPASLGWIATSPIGSWTKPVYLCRWGSEEFFTLDRNECINLGTAVLVGDPLGYGR
jgi:hypothetical protein